MTTCLPNAERPPDQPLFDGHVDLLYDLLQSEPIAAFSQRSTGGLTKEVFCQSGLNVINSALYCADRFNGPAAALHLCQLIFIADLLIDRLPIIRSVADLQIHWRSGLVTGQLRLLENADSLVDLGVDCLTRWGIHTVGLTHISRNRLADGNAEANPTGLTPAGRHILRQLERQGTIIDLAHLAEPSFWEVLERYDGPVCVTHTGLRRFCDRPRNLTIEQLKAVSDREGMIGLSVAPEMLRPHAQADVDDFVEQTAWLLDHLDARHVGIGSDFGGFDGQCNGLENHADFLKLKRKLSAADLANSVVADLFGGNWYRFYRTHLSAKEIL